MTTPTASQPSNTSTQPSAEPMPADQAALAVVASYDNYPEAQHAVDLLSDKGFPVEHVQIVGSGLRMVEVVTGRMTVLRAALLGALSGAWLGLFIGLLFVLFIDGPNPAGMMLFPVLIGVAWGAIFGGLGHLGTRGQRDFTSMQQFVADRYELSVAHELSLRARQILDAGRE